MGAEQTKPLAEIRAERALPMAGILPAVKKLTEAEEAALVGEIIGYSIFGMVIELMGCFSVFGTAGTVENMDLNKIGLYEVDNVYFLIDQIFEFVGAAIKITFCILEIVFYVDRLPLYGTLYNPLSAVHILDYIWIVLLSFSICGYLYRLIFALMQIPEFADIAQGPSLQEFYNLDTIFKQKQINSEIKEAQKAGITHSGQTLIPGTSEIADYQFILILSYLYQSFFGPKKISLYTDMIAIIPFIFSEHFGWLCYFAVPWVFVGTIEWLVFPFATFLDVPIYPFEKWFSPLFE